VLIENLILEALEARDGVSEIQALTISQLEALSEVLLDFTDHSELIEWLQVNLA